MSTINTPTVILTEEPESSLREWFKKQKIQVSIESFIKCKLLPVTDNMLSEIGNSNADAIVVTSYNAARWLKENHHSININQTVVYASTKKVASLLLPYFKEVRISSHISAEFTANKVLEDKSIGKVLYLTASQPLNMVTEILQSGGVVCQLLSVYQNLLVPHKTAVQEPDAVLFSNEKEVLSFIAGDNKIGAKTKVYTLGNSTARLVVEKLGVSPIVFSSRDIGGFFKKGISDLIHGSNYSKSNQERLIFY